MTFDKLLKSGQIVRGDDERLDVVRLPIGIKPLDEILGGGLPYGTCTMIVGPESTGKTILAQYIAAAVQKTERPHVLYLDAERSYDRSWWQTSGVDTAKLFVAQPMAGEQLIDLMIAAMKEDAELGLVILDSIAAMPPSMIVDNSAERSDVGSHARLVSKMYQKVVEHLPGRLFVATNQLRENIGGYEERYPGGNAPRYYNHVILRTRREGWIKDGEQRVGFNMEVTTRKNKTASPQQSCTLPFVFNSQLDLLSIRIDEAIAAGTIVQRTPYYTVTVDGKERKLLGKANLRNFLLENPQALAN